MNATLQVRNRTRAQASAGCQRLLCETCRQAIALEERTEAAVFLHISPSCTPSFLLYHSTSPEVEKCVRKMCLFLMVEESMVIYTLIRNRENAPVQKVSNICNEEERVSHVSRTGTGCAEAFVPQIGIRANDTGRESPRPGRDGGVFCSRLSQ